MKIKPINAEISVSDQITVNDLEELSKQHIKSIICNRPDHEVEDEHSVLEIEKHAMQHGIEMHYLPVDHATIDSKDVSDFEQAYVSSSKPVHAYCRSGMRAVTLWSLMQIRQGLDIDTAIVAAQQAGYDLSNIGEKFAHVLKK